MTSSIYRGMTPPPIMFPDGYDDTWMDGCYAARKIENNEWLIVIPLTFGRARICVAEGGYTGDFSIEHWCMDAPEDAVVAWLRWPELPEKWNRHQRRDRVLEWPDGRTDEEG